MVGGDEGGRVVGVVRVALLFRVHQRAGEGAVARGRPLPVRHLDLFAIASSEAAADGRRDFMRLLEESASSL